MVTMLLGGLWHGASWRFIFWGGLHGIYLVIERGLRKTFKKAYFFQQTGMRLVLVLVTYFFLCITWVFFRAEDFASAFALISTMFYPMGGNLVEQGEIYKVLMISALLLLFQWKLRDSSLESFMANLPWWFRGLVAAFILISIALAPVDERAFIYFQF
jgi:alginate O-acetyltransferase complex protein AlgI